MELKEIFGEELANQLTISTDATAKAVIAKLATAKLIAGDATMFVPKSEFNEKNELVKSLKAQIATADENLKAIKAEAESLPVLKAKITEMQTAAHAERTQFETAQAKAKKSTALLVALMDNGVSDPTARDVLSKTFDIDKLELDESGKPKGFDLLLKPIKENMAFKGMFGTVKMVGQEHQHGDGGEPISDLERKLAEAEKAGKPLVERIALKRLIAEAQAQK
jgi:hypothetical protein